MVEALRIRRYAPGDAAAVAEVIRVTMALSNRADYGMERLQPLIDAITAERVAELNATRVCFVAEANGEIVGTAALEEDELLSCFVLPAAQGRGVGTELLRAVEAEARRAGEGLLRVGASLAGAAFYAARGYRATGARLEGAAGTHLAMVKEIDEVDAE